MLHNFFPPDAEDLILNLASPDTDRRQKTLAFFRRGIDWSVVSEAKYYSVHGGYINDPVGRDEHGFTFPSSNTTGKTPAMHRYIESLISLATYAQARGITLLVENNVMAKHHLGQLLLSTPGEFKDFFRQCPPGLPAGILLDWGHWQITAQTLHEDLNGFRELRERIFGLHLHSNDRRVDQHAPFAPRDHDLEMLRQFSPAFITLEGHYPKLAALQTATLETEKVFQCLNHH
jgi:sugar phosphate isomerase/epimerase